MQQVMKCSTNQRHFQAAALHSGIDPGGGSRQRTGNKSTPCDAYPRYEHIAQHMERSRRFWRRAKDPPMVVEAFVGEESS